MENPVLRYSDLTIEEKKFICNGCGGKGSLIPVPSFIFKASCDQHDFYYWRGGTKEDKIKADEDFYKYMKIDIQDNNYGYFKKIWYYSWAYTYFKSVSSFGNKYFYFGKKRTREDLEKLISV